MQRWLIVLLLILMLIAPLASPAKAQSAVEFDRLQVDIWPEYDRPEVLVIYRMSLADTVSLPAQISLHIPAAAGQPYNVANQDVDGMLYNLEYSLTPEGDWVRVTFTTPTPSLQMEFYDPGLQKNGNDRSYKLNWTTDYKVNNLTVRVQKPFNASSMVIAPQMGTAQQEADGLSYYTTVIGAVAAGTPVSLSISYTKPDDQLSVTPMPVQASTPVQAPRQWDWSSILPWILGGVGLVVIALGGLWFWQSGRKSSGSGGGKRHRSAGERQGGGEGAVYCQQCGKKAGPGDAFCRSCGTRLRRE